MLIVWIMIWLSNGLYPKVQMTGYLKLSILLCCCILYLIFVKKQTKIKIDKRIMMIAVIFILLQTITIIINGINPAFDFYLISVIIIGVLFTAIVDKEDFINGYRKGIFWITVISIFLFLIGLLTNVLSQIPTILLKSTEYDGTYTLMGIFVIRIRNTYTYYRNCGIFSEPGQFQIFLSIGLIIELFYKKKHEGKNIVVLIIGYLTCWSTNGFITLLFIIVAYLFNNNSKNNKVYQKFKYLILLMLLILCAIGVKTSILNSITNEIEEKIHNFFSEYSYNDTGTGLERKRAIDVSIKMFFSNPIFGLGYKGMEEYILSLSATGFIMTFSPMNWFARFGIIYGLIANLGYFSFFSLMGKNKLSKIILILAVFTMISAQAINADIMSIILIFYGWKNLIKNKLKMEKNNELR